MNKNSSDLIADALFADPRIAKAKLLIAEAVSEHQKGIQQIKPPNPALADKTQKLLAEYEELRGGKLFYPFLGSGIGNGTLIELIDGSVKYDLIGGIGVHWFGHSSRILIQAAIDAAISNTIMQGNLLQNRDSIQLAKLLVDKSGLKHCFFSTSGVMANENALKLAFQKNKPASRILSFTHCFAGRTLTLSQITDKPAYREGLPANIFVDYIPFYDLENPESSAKEALGCLKMHLKRYPKQHAAMLFEFVQGEGGIYPGTTAFFMPLLKILKEEGIAIIADEVQTFGRTSQLFAYQHFGLEEYIDIATIGKLSHVCATLFTVAYKPRPGLLSQTFTGSTSAIHAAIAILHELTEGGYFGGDGINMQLQNHFFKCLSQISEKHPQLIKGPYGIGTMIAFTPYDGENQRVIRFSKALFENGVISFTAGSDPTRIRFLLPAGAITTKDIDNVTDLIEKTLVQEKDK